MRDQEIHDFAINCCTSATTLFVLVLLTVCIFIKINILYLVYGWPYSCYISASSLEVVLTYQQTIARQAEISGIGLHPGVTVNLNLVAAPANTGIVFRRTDLEGFRVEARV